MGYQETLDYIWGLVNFETTPPATRAPYTLERMRRLLDRLDHPERALRVVHLAGTKGKGSTAAMIERVLRETGLHTALYSSPHLHEPRERFRLDGEPISRADFARWVDRLRPHIEALGDVTTFEALTALAFLWFAEQKPDVVVLETGLGGRLDATNLATPLLSVITPLALEHVAVLGNTIEQIADEKGGIIKPGVPVVVAAQAPAARARLAGIAARRDAALHYVPDDYSTRLRAQTIGGSRFDLIPVGERRLPAYRSLVLGLLGAHQVENAAVAVRALLVLRRLGVGWDERALRAGLARVRWPARVEIVRRDPLVIVDGAHTRESAEALAATVRALRGGNVGRGVLVLGLSSDKAPEPILEALAPLVDRLFLTRAHHPRAADPAVLAEAPGVDRRRTRVIPDVSTAARSAVAESAPGALVLVAGSLFVAAEARAALLGDAQPPDEPWREPVS